MSLSMEDTPLRSSSQAVLACNDLVSEILERLPLKSVIRFKILSKEWNNLLSIPKSIKIDPNNHSPLGLILAHKDTLNHPSIHFSSETKPKHATTFPSIISLEKMGVFNIINSSNGLFLCRFCVKYQFRHCVINPGSKQVSMVPQEPANPWSENTVFALDFHPLESPYYRIICFRDTYMYNDKMMRKRGGLEILIYSSENGTWKTSRNSLETEYNSMVMESPVSWNGKILPPHNCVTTICFDVNKEEMYTIPSPMKMDNDITRQHLGEWCGNLYSVYSVGRFTEIQFQVFEWDKDSSKWFQKYSVNASKMFSEFPSAVMEVEYTSSVREKKKKLSYNYRILAVVSGDQRADPALIVAIRGAIISYSFCLETVQMLLDIPELQNYVCWLNAFPFYGDFLSYQTCD